MSPQPNRYPKPDRHPSVSPAFDLRLARVEEFFKARSFSANTQKAYRRELKRFLEWTDEPWSAMTPRVFARYKDHLRSSLAASSVNRALCALKSFFSWLSRAYPDGLPTNPVETISLQKLPLPPARDLTDETVAALWQAVAAPSSTQRRDAALLAVLAHGLRAGEVVALNLADYDGIRLTVRQGKDDSSGTVPLTGLARTHLNAYLAWRRQQGERFGPNQPLFLSHNPVNPGGRLGYQGIYYTIRDLGVRAGIEGLTPHRLRHTYATKLLLKGMDSLHARTLTRHKSEASFKRYAKRALSAAAERAFYSAIGEEPPTQTGGWEEF